MAVIVLQDYTTASFLETPEGFKSNKLKNSNSKTYKFQTYPKSHLDLWGLYANFRQRLILQVRECDFDTKPLAQHSDCDSLRPFDSKTSVGCQVGGKKGMIL